MKTIRVRIAVAIDEDGDWVAWGAAYVSDAMLVRDVGERASYMVADDHRTVFVEADVPIPEAVTVVGEVVDADALPILSSPA